MAFAPTEKTKTAPITARQQQALDAIAQLQSELGKLPSRRQLADRLSCSLTRAQELVQVLRLKGCDV